MTFNDIVELVRSERHRQIAKWGNRRNLNPNDLAADYGGGGR